MAEYSKYSRGPGDSILALLEPGEYVLNRNAVDEIGEEKLDEINFEDSPRFDMSQRSNFQVGGMLGDMMGYQRGGSAEQNLMDMVNRAKQSQTEQDSLNTLYSQPMDRFSPDESFTREALLRNLGLPQESTIDTLYHQGNDIGLQLKTPEGGSYKYNRSGNTTDKKKELNQKISQSESNLRSDMSSAREGFRGNYPEADKALQLDLTKEEYQGALDKLRAGYVDMGPFERMDYEKGQKVSDDLEETSYQKMMREMNERRDKAKKSGNFDSFFDGLDGFQMGGILGMQSGGSTLSYGGDVSNTQTLDDIYQKMGMQPTGPQRGKFERQFKYDPSREGVIFEDYARTMSGATSGAQQNLLGATTAAGEYEAKAGFAGSGGVQKSMEQSRGSIMGDFLQKEGAAKSSLFKDVRGEREKWAADVAAGLGRLEGQEGTEGYGTPGEATVGTGGDVFSGEEGTGYMGTGFGGGADWNQG